MTTGLARSSVKRAKLFGDVAVRIVPTRFDVPAEAGAQHQLAAAGQQLQNLDEVDRQRQCDRQDGIVEQPLEIGLGQCPLAELRQRFLLLGAAAQLVFEIDPIGVLLIDCFGLVRVRHVRAFAL